MHCVAGDVRDFSPLRIFIVHRASHINLISLQALMALFVLSSKDGWVNIMYQGLDAVGVDQQPIENYNEWRLLFFISFLLLVAFFVLNMFVGVVVENFHRCRAEQEKEERARREEKRARKLENRRRSMICLFFSLSFQWPVCVSLFVVATVTTTTSLFVILLVVEHVRANRHAM